MTASPGAFAQLLDNLDIRGKATEILTSASKEILAAEGTKLLFEGFPEVLQTLAEETVKAIVGSAVGPLLRLLLKSSDKIEKKLDKLIRELFLADARV